MISAKVGFSRVRPVVSGEQALKLLESTESVFDCLLFDINMPDMDGIELCRRVRQIPRYRETPIVMLTAMRDMKHMGEAFRAGATDYVSKPFDIEELGARLQLAQEAGQAREKTLARTADMGPPSIPAPDYGFELPEGIRIVGVTNLVDHTVLSNYLTQLPRKEATDVQVFAVNLDRIEKIHSRSSPEQFASLLEHLATTAGDCFGVNRPLMAYASNANLLVVAFSASPISASNLEVGLENRLKGNIAYLGSGDGTAIGVSVGGPVQLQGTKAERARTTTNRAIALAATRALDKRSRPVAGLVKRYPH
ncbi:PleD family two-component system response regulator [Roseovarius sp. A-2]|uniref:response regulator n=1 Tax=Roseovarius sp. A-2 TaxID=1570360 RepID=UPI0020CB3F3C|nr:response regulator [Roseovarius sp. A-2]